MATMKNRLILLVCLLIVLILHRQCSPLLLVLVESLLLCSALGMPPLGATKVFFLHIIHFIMATNHHSSKGKGRRGNRLPRTEISTKTPEMEDF